MDSVHEVCVEEVGLAGTVRKMKVAKDCLCPLLGSQTLLTLSVFEGTVSN